MTAKICPRCHIPGHECREWSRFHEVYYAHLVRQFNRQRIAERAKARKP